MSKKGYKGTSLQNITDLVGIDKSTLFHYFKNKEEILLEVINIAHEQLINIADLVLNLKNMAPEEKLRLAITNHIVSLVKVIGNVNVFNNEMRYLSRKNKKKYLKIRKNYELYFVRIIDKIKKGESGLFKGMDSKIVTYGILGMCNWVGRWYKKDGKFKPEEIANIFFQMIR
jgi:hypothetical protein